MSQNLTAQRGSHRGVYGRLLWGILRGIVTRSFDHSSCGVCMATSVDLILRLHGICCDYLGILQP